MSDTSVPLRGPTWMSGSLTLPCPIATVPSVPDRFRVFPGNGQTPTGHRSPGTPFRGGRNGPGVEASPQDHRRGTPEAGSQRSRVGQGAREQTRNSPESACAALTRRPTPADPSQALCVALRGQR